MCYLIIRPIRDYRLNMLGKGETIFCKTIGLALISFTQTAFTTSDIWCQTSWIRIWLNLSDYHFFTQCIKEENLIRYDWLLWHTILNVSFSRCKKVRKPKQIKLKIHGFLFCLAVYLYIYTPSCLYCKNRQNWWKSNQFLASTLKVSLSLEEVSQLREMEGCVTAVLLMQPLEPECWQCARSFSLKSAKKKNWRQFVFKSITLHLTMGRLQLKGYVFVIHDLSCPF